MGSQGQQPADDPFPFFDLPKEMQYQIINNVDVKTYTSLLRCSRTTKRLCDRGPWFFYRRVASLHNYSKAFDVCCKPNEPHCPLGILQQKHAKLYADMFVLEDLLDTIGVLTLHAMCAYNKFRADTLISCSDLQCTSESLGNLCKQLCVKNWHARQFTRQNLLPLVDVEMMLLVGTDCDDAMLRLLKPSTLHLLNAPRITDAGINLFIKDWLNGERSLIEFEMSWNLSQRNQDALLDGLPLNPIWTPESHGDSLLAHLPFEAIQEQLATVGMDRLYTIFSHRDIADYRILSIGGDKIKIEKNPLGEAEILQRIGELIAQ